MLLNTVVAAGDPAAAPIQAPPDAQRPSNVWKLQPTTVFSAHWFYNEGLLSLRGVHTHYFFTDEWQRRLIGKHFYQALYQQLNHEPQTSCKILLRNEL